MRTSPGGRRPEYPHIGSVRRRSTRALPSPFAGRACSTRRRSSRRMPTRPLPMATASIQFPARRAACSIAAVRAIPAPRYSIRTPTRNIGRAACRSIRPTPRGTTSSFPAMSASTTSPAPSTAVSALLAGTDLPTGICQNPPNVNPYVYQQRALLVALQQWVANGTAPPASRYARISDGTLLPPTSVGFPNMAFATGIADYPTVVFTGLYNTRNLLFWGPKFYPDDESGILDRAARCHRSRLQHPRTGCRCRWQ